MTRSFDLGMRVGLNRRRNAPIHEATREDGAPALLTVPQPGGRPLYDQDVEVHLSASKTGALSIAVETEGASITTIAQMIGDANESVTKAGGSMGTWVHPWRRPLAAATVACSLALGTIGWGWPSVPRDIFRVAVKAAPTVQVPIKAPPCEERQQEINKLCWYKVADKGPCFKGEFTHDGKCFIGAPVDADGGQPPPSR